MEFNGETDHVHLLVSVRPTVAIANLVGRLKGLSSHELRTRYHSHVTRFLWGKHFWSPSYCVVSVGGATIDVVRQYIEDQDSPRPVSPACSPINGRVCAGQE